MTDRIRSLRLLFCYGLTKEAIFASVVMLIHLHHALLKNTELWLLVIPFMGFAVWLHNSCRQSIEELELSQNMQTVARLWQGLCWLIILIGVVAL